MMLPPKNKVGDYWHHAGQAGEIYPWPRAFFISAIVFDTDTGASCVVFAVLFKACTSSMPALRSSFDGW